MLHELYGGSPQIWVTAEYRSTISTLLSLCMTLNKQNNPKTVAYGKITFRISKSKDMLAKAKSDRQEAADPGDNE